MSRIQLAMLLAIACLGLLGATGRLKFLRDEFPDRRRRPVAVALFLAILTATVFYPAAAADEGTIDPATLWFPALFLGHALLAAFLVGWWRLRGDVSFPHLLHLDRMEPDDVRRGIWLGVSGWIATIVVTGIVALLAAPFGFTANQREIPALMIWFAQQPITRKLIIVVVAMTVEEAFFRGFLQRRIGLVPSSILFAVGHASYGLPLMVVSVFVISLVLGWGFRHTGRLLPCIVAHGVFDGIQLLIVIPWAIQQLGPDAGFVAG